MTKKDALIVALLGTLADAIKMVETYGKPKVNAGKFEAKLLALKVAFSNAEKAIGEPEVAPQFTIKAADDSIFVHHYEINVARMEQHMGECRYVHFFATAERSCQSQREVERVYSELMTRFPAPEFDVRVTAMDYEVKQVC